MKERLFSATEGAVLTTAPGIILAACGKRTWLATPQGLSWYFPDFFLERNPRFFQQEETFNIELDLLLSDPQPQKFEWKCYGLEQFKSAFSELTEIRKAVPYLSYRAQGKIDPVKLIKSALIYLKKTPGTHLYGYWSQSEGMIGVTPEILFDCSHGVLQTAAVAGTTSKEKSEQLKRDPKLREEHQLVIEGIHTALEPFGNLEVGSTEIHSFGRLAHLVTPITLYMSGSLAFEECASALHPTPALGTFPREAGKQWLKQYATNLPRNRFGAPAGYCNLGSGRGKCVVAIRNIQWRGDQLEILCGCGITAQSSFEMERDEISLKFEAVKEIFQL